MDKVGLYIGVIVFIYWFGFSFNEYVYFYVCVVDGVFEEVEGEGDVDVIFWILLLGVIFYVVIGIDVVIVVLV